MEYGIYDDTGRIRRTVIGPELQSAAQAQVGEHLYTGKCYQQLHRVVDGEIVSRSSMTAQIDKTEVTADDTDKVTISDIPSAAVATVHGAGAREVVGPITDGTLELTFDTEGTYTIKLEKFPYKDQEFTVNAS